MERLDVPEFMRGAMLAAGVDPEKVAVEAARVAPHLDEPDVEPQPPTQASIDDDLDAVFGT